MDRNNQAVPTEGAETRRAVIGSAYPLLSFVETHETDYKTSYSHLVFIATPDGQIFTADDPGSAGELVLRKGYKPYPKGFVPNLSLTDYLKPLTAENAGYSVLPLGADAETIEKVCDQIADYVVSRTSRQ